MNTPLSALTAHLEEFAPLALQESYDNAGLLTGDSGETVKGVLICLDCTPKVVDEAIRKNCNVIVSHHPVVFTGLKRLTGDSSVEQVLLKAIRHNIAIYAAHTNLDNMAAGVNKKIADKIGLTSTRILQPIAGRLCKLITFCPVEYADQVRNALFDAGAGRIGNYSECSFTAPGAGTFKAGENANPYVGEAGKRHTEKEDKIEVVFPGYIQKTLVAKLKEAHPYEEPAYDIINLANENPYAGAGIIGELEKEEDETVFLKRIKSAFNCGSLRYTALLDKPVKKVALCGGSGSFLLKEAIRQKADVFITADFKYHQFFDAEDKLLIADIGHYESEQFTMELFYDIITKKFTTFAVHLTEINTNPVNYL